MVWLLLLLFNALNALDFSAAQQRLLEHHPDLRAAQINIEQGLWDMQAAALRPNPTLSIDFEGYTQPNCNDEDTLSAFISQPFEMGGKRQARREVARTEWQKVHLKKQLTALTLLHKFKKAFIQAAYKQEMCRLAQQALSLAEQRFALVADKIKGGKLSLLEENKSRLNLALAKSKKLDCEKEATRAYLSLFRFWGETCPIEELNFPFSQCPGCMPKVDIEGHPQLLLGAQEASLSRALLRQARAARYPDLSLGIGYSASLQGSDNSILAGLEMPLPLFDRNEAAIQRNWLDIEKQEQQYAALLRYLNYELKMKQDEWQHQLKNVRIFTEEALVWAKRTEALVKEGIEFGKLGQDDLQEAQEAVLDNEKAALEAYLQYHLALVDLEYFYSESL